MYTHFDAEKAERKIAKVAQTKVMLSKILEQNLGFIADKDFKAMLRNVAEAIDDGAYHEMQDCQKVIDEFERVEQSRHERYESTFYAARA